MAAEMAIKGKAVWLVLMKIIQWKLGLIDLQLIKGGKEFDTSQSWFQNMLKEIGQE